VNSGSKRVEKWHNSHGKVALFVEDEIEEVEAAGFLRIGSVFFQGDIDSELDAGVDLTDGVCIFEKKEIIGHGGIGSRIDGDSVALEWL